MRIKSYFANTVEAALDLAGRELGEDAVLLNCRPAPPDARHLGIHEVVFGVEAEPEPRSPGLLLAPPPNSAPDSPAPAPVAAASDWEACRRQIERLEKTIANHLFQPGGRPAAAGRISQHDESPDRAGSSALVRFLIERDFPPALAEDLSAEVEHRLARWTSTSSSTRTRPYDEAPGSTRGANTRAPGGTGIFRWMPGEVAGEFRQRGIVADILLDTVAEQLPRPSPGASLEPIPGERRILALTGPPGGGKTTMLAKLAATYGLDRQMSVAILSTDTIRISAADQLRTYATIMGLPCEIAETPRGLERALAEQASRQLILIDTPGWGPAELTADAGLWSDFFRRRPDIEQHLVLPANLAGREIQAAARRFQIFGVSRLLLTHADEITAGGALVAAILAAGLAVSYLGTGQSIPEDYEAASTARLLDLAFADESFLEASLVHSASAVPAAKAEAATAATGRHREFSHV